VSAVTGEFLFRQAKELPKRDRVPVLFGQLGDPKSVRQQLRSWLARYKPDAVIGINDGVFWALREIGWLTEQGPRRFASAQSGEFELDERIPGARFPLDLIGATAIQLLDGLVQRGEKGLPTYPYRHLIPAAWHPGALWEPDS